MNRPSGRVPLWRGIGFVALLAGWSLACATLARCGPLSAVLAGVAFAIPMLSVGEWLVHAYVYHAGIPGLRFVQRLHHRGHHFVIYPPREYLRADGHPFIRLQTALGDFGRARTAKENVISLLAQFGLYVAAGVPLALLPAWLIAGDDQFFLAGVSATTVIGSWLVAWVHGIVHVPKGRTIEGAAWFRWLDLHHYIHHVDVGSNFNFMVPICDVLLGTNRMSLTESESRRFPSFEDATRLRARAMSEP